MSVDDRIFGFWLASADTPMITSMGRYHPEGAPEDSRLGAADDPRTWFQAYHMHASLAEARADAAQCGVDRHEFETGAEDEGEDPGPDEDGEMTPADFEPTVYPGFVTGNGDLYLSDVPADEMAGRIGSDDPEAMMNTTGTVEFFSRDEVYASHGATPRFAADESGPHP